MTLFTIVEHKKRVADINLRDALANMRLNVAVSVGVWFECLEPFEVSQKLPNKSRALIGSKNLNY